MRFLFSATRIALALFAACAAASAQQQRVLPLDESLYPGLRALRAPSGPLVCVVDTEHPDRVRSALRGRTPKHHALERVRLLIELEAAGVPAVLVHASLIAPPDLARPEVKAVLVCGRNQRTSVDEDARLFALLRSCPVPLLCTGGAQGLLASAFGGKTGTMRQLNPGETDPDPSYTPGVFKEVGHVASRIVARDNLFDGLGETLTLRQRHSSEVKILPAEFTLLASSDACRVHACRHRTRPLYGVQGAPDRYDDTRPDGLTILRNFFTLAGLDVATLVPRAREAFRAQAGARVRAVCVDPARLAETRAPFVAVIDLEDPEVVGSTRRGSGTGLTHAEKIAQFKGRIEGELAGLPALVVHYIEIRRADFANPHLRAIVLTGAGSPTVAPMTADLRAVIREARVPIIGLCAGHQHIARAHGAPLGTLRALRPGEPDPHPKYNPGLFKEWGFFPVRILARDPLFDGLPDAIVVQEYHVGEVQSVPPGFDLLASTDECAVQAIKRRDRLVYGTQFHPECYDDAHPHGRRVLQNFFRIAAGALPAPPAPGPRQGR